ncbi:MAG: hypothetical protein QOF60_304 [Actinomycetota bacterium]|nr:hypothetical protein [Actinomycetota bacterium]
MTEQSPFEALEATFRLLCQGPSPLAVHGREVGPPFPRRVIPLTELGGMLLHPSTPYEARDAAVGLLARRAAAQGGAWTVGLAGVLLPGLRNALIPLARTWPQGVADLEADALAGLLEALAAGVPRERVASRLVSRAAGRAKHRFARELAAHGRHGSGALPAEPHRPWGHPDFVLAEAVQAGVLSDEEADLIGETRLGGVPLRHYAASRGGRHGTYRMRRNRAENRLVVWVRGRNV